MVANDGAWNLKIPIIMLRIAYGLWGQVSHSTFTGIREEGTTERIEDKSRSRSIDHGIHGKRQEIKGKKDLGFRSSKTLSLFTSVI